jgi:hypothetical protein
MSDIGHGRADVVAVLDQLTIAVLLRVATTTNNQE